ncbi:MAG: hypothetical protein KDA50_02050, partial [Rhodobacteraceae bacterium]|nr:hypothetical protein [Paracoccaceae bacterium]
AICQHDLAERRLELEAEDAARKTEVFLARAMACKRLYHDDQDTALLHDGCYDFFMHYGLPKNKSDPQH